ncbi:MAG: zinc ribbon domain-containing protein [Candidatus Helarchaeota archaeon]
MVSNNKNNVQFVNSKFISFGTLYMWIGILYIFQIFSSFLDIFFHYFTPIFSLINHLLALTNFILLLIALADINSANKILNELKLSAFYSKIISAIIISIIGNVIILVSQLVNPMAFSYLIDYLTRHIPSLPPRTILVVIFWSSGILLVWISYILTYIGYKSLEIFFSNHLNDFPQKIALDAASGARNLKRGALMWILEIFIITIIVGVIFNIIGYFETAALQKLAVTPINESLIDHKEEDKLINVDHIGPQPTSPDKMTESGPLPIKDTPPKFCVMCGTKLDPDDKFCPNCGTPTD